LPAVSKSNSIKNEGNSSVTNPWRHIPHKSNAVVWILSLSLVIGGCAPKKLPEYPAQPPNSYPYSQVQDGLAIGIKPLTDPQESETYFGTDLLSRGVLAIFVSAENQGASGTFVLSKDRFTLQTNQKEEQAVSGREQVQSPARKVVYKTILGIGAILTGGRPDMFPGLPAVLFSKIHEGEESVIRKFIDEELFINPIPHGQGTHGFVYFPRPPGFPGPGQWVLHLEVQNIDSKEGKVFDFTLDGK
jgi:hypothetical protein